MRREPWADGAPVFSFRQETRGHDPKEKGPPAGIRRTLKSNQQPRPPIYSLSRAAARGRAVSKYNRTVDGRTIKKKANGIAGQYSAHLREMLESPAWRVMSLSGHRFLARVEIELCSHGGCDNGNLQIPKEDFVDYGIHPRMVPPAAREVEALGLLYWKRGQGGNAAEWKTNQFGLTYVNIISGNGAREPKHEWRRIKTIEEAEAIAKKARANKNPVAVIRGKQRHERRMANIRAAMVGE